MTAVTSFLLAFPALFSIINPLGGAIIFNEATGELAPAQKVQVAGRVGLYSLLVLLGALWGGAYVLNFFGITLGALRIAGGTVVALNAWHMLTSHEHHEDRRRSQADGSPPEDGDGMDMAFFPLTMPFTTGPGSIAVAITLGAERPQSGIGLLAFFVGVSTAAAVNAAVVWVVYRYSGRITGWIGVAGRNILSRLTAFLLLCIGVQIMISGVRDVIGTLHR